MTARFSDQVSETDYMDDVDNSEVLQLQQRLLSEQDHDLDRLSDAIGRQRELGLLIGDELSYHVELLEETEGMVDHTERTLDRAKRNLSKISKKVKNKGHFCIIFSLLLILVVLIIVLTK
ncbi:12052_t:CDS:2 [Dentiscutata erythropus]|uniref:12052_t:CDS:1 n=1 Tax=Dentiscutata erythropus TaxID=1348616 RepID=A0A9N9F740_9GLOM|nr:12052_t:CDS:2 [Dentiscutata erythropus]